MRTDIVPGAVFPDYELPDHTTKRRKLSELQAEDPMVDWDITTPELKAAWEEDRKELFHPYGKTFLKTLAEQE